MAKLLSTERQYHTKSRRTGIYDDLEKCFNTSSLSKDDAIENAHRKRNFKEAADEGDVLTIKTTLQDLNPPQNEIEEQQNIPKQLNWASMKFPQIDADVAEERD